MPQNQTNENRQNNASNRRLSRKGMGQAIEHAQQGMAIDKAKESLGRAEDGSGRGNVRVSPGVYRSEEVARRSSRVPSTPVMGPPMTVEPQMGMFPMEPPQISGVTGLPMNPFMPGMGANLPFPGATGPFAAPAPVFKPAFQPPRGGFFGDLSQEQVDIELGRLMRRR